MKIGLVQQSVNGTLHDNMLKIKKNIEECAGNGAQLVVLQELHNTPYFCQTEDTAMFDLAESIPGPSTDFYSVIFCNSIFHLVYHSVQHSSRITSTHIFELHL